MLNNLFDAQQYNDFFPTSQKCLTHFDDYSNYIEKEENILEPSAGIGSIVHYLQLMHIYANMQPDMHAHT